MSSILRKTSKFRPTKKDSLSYSSSSSSSRSSSSRSSHASKKRRTQKRVTIDISRNTSVSPKQQNHTFLTNRELAYNKQTRNKHSPIPDYVDENLILEHGIARQNAQKQRDIAKQKKMERIFTKKIIIHKVSPRPK